MGHLALFKEGSVVPRIRATDKQAALEELVDAMVNSAALPAAKRGAVLKALLAREQLGSTGVGGGVAIPHVKLEGLSRSSAALGISSDGLDYAAIDGEPVHIVFMVVSPAEKAQEHLAVLQWISKLARHRDFVRFMRRSSTVAEVLDLLAEMGG
ncbi:MAG: PTS sugar transporter subunit IIA [Planctomycetota bacterium]